MADPNFAKSSLIGSIVGSLLGGLATIPKLIKASPAGALVTSPWANSFAPSGRDTVPNAVPFEPPGDLVTSASPIPMKPSGSRVACPYAATPSAGFLVAWAFADPSSPLPASP